MHRNFGRSCPWKLAVLALLFHITLSSTFVSCSPVPGEDDSNDDFDMPDDYGSFFSNSLPKYDLSDHPLVSSITLEIKSNLETKGSKPMDAEEDDNSSTTEVGDSFTSAAPVDDNIVKALEELEYFSKMLELKWEYIDARKKEDPSWPVGLTSRIGTEKATQADADKFETDLYQAISGLVLMKMMEERLALINKYVDDEMAKNPDADLKKIFGGSDKVRVAEGLFALKYLEGFLHATNTLITQTFTQEEWANENSDIFSDSSSDSVIFEPVGPPPKPSSDDEDLDAGAIAFTILVLTAIGIFFLLFVAFYALLKCLRKCMDMGLDAKKKSKYEQI